MAEQDRYGGWFGGQTTHAPSPSDIANELPKATGSHIGFRPTSAVCPTAIGLLQSSILPSFRLHAGLSTVAYGLARCTGRAEAKDYLWPIGITGNAWWSAVGTRVVYENVSLQQAWSTLGYSQKLLLGGVSAWGVRLLYHIASRSVQRGKDDARYEAEKEKPGFWNKALFTMFLPEAFIQTLITLPLTLPFRATLESVRIWPPSSSGSILHAFAIFLFSTGYALEVFADTQLKAHKKNSSGLFQGGVWSIVRHPNYIGDALMHASFSILLMGAGILHPIGLLGPITNYIFLRYIGGDSENDASQEDRYVKNDLQKLYQLEEYKLEKNSFWPSAREVRNKWTWTCITVGVGGVVLERGLRAILQD